MEGGNRSARLWLIAAVAGAVGGIAGWAVAADMASSAGQIAPAPSAAIASRLNAQGQVQVDVHYDCRQAPPTTALIAAGLVGGASVKVPPLCLQEGWVAPDALSRLATVPGVTRVSAPNYVLPRHPRPYPPPSDRSSLLQRSPSLLAQSAANGIDHNGVTIIRADQFVAQTGTGGLGATVGIQSGGVASLGTIQARNELPAVQVLLPSDGASYGFADEGTALLEEVHAVAPSAGLTFCGPNTFVEYLSCMQQLINAGATILVDDIAFTDEDLMASDSPDVQSVEQILAQNPSVAMFTAAGNSNGSYWEGQYAPVSLASLGLAPLSCPSAANGQTDNYVAQFNGSPSQLLNVAESADFPITLAWADPAGHAASDFDVYWIDSQDSTNTGCFSTSGSTDPELSEQIGLTGGTYTLYIATPDTSLAGKFLKLWIGGDGLTSISSPTAGSLVTPQALASGVTTVGAVNGSDGVGSHIESFSSLGPVTFSFPSRTTMQAPVLVAPDGINVDAAGTYFEAFLFPDGNFYGTSASVPNAGAVAALIRGAFPGLSVPQLVSALEGGAAQLGSNQPDGTFGYGRIDALGALATLPAPSITALPDSAITAGSSSASYPFTVSGTGGLHFSVTSSNAALIPPSVVPAGSPGISIAPSGCGVSTMACTLVVTAASGQGATVNVIFSVLDGANRSAPASMMITVTGNQAATPSPTPTPTPTPSGGRGGGGGFDLWDIGMLTLICWLRARRSQARPTRSLVASR